MRGIEVAVPDRIDVTLGIDVTDKPLERFIPDMVNPVIDL
ncbi:hypothetical protein KL86DYS1_12268 [uncultured Dysgonomonas sp.]|uniref:Uncharacterized protein n=1 Tax=uncultured Dysgonomonas sp. TaxID=206096 RepID=A0A212JHS6_9BACT|nr:hypothetical protein KL86DYS1_12268 [uncultured Dysgonomonas sp.]